MFKFLLLSLFLGTAASADYLDPPYKVFNPPINLETMTSLEKMNSAESIVAASSQLRSSNTLATILQQSPVKSQGSRGTCSIFSATAYIEHYLGETRDFDTSVNLSEEWLEYLIMRRTGTEGSSSGFNFSYLMAYGTPMESAWPYIGETWDNLSDSSLAEARCSIHKDSELDLKKCLLGHKSPHLLQQSNNVLYDQNSVYYDPSFALARYDAAVLRDNYLFPASNSYGLSYVSEIKNLLDNGEPVLLDIDFYYGAWNHRKAPGMGIGRNMDHWAKGIVGHPEAGSVDLVKSKEASAGHSVLLVGYDDSKVVKKTILMENGESKEFTYRGVYYFKNSWGTDGFGVDFELDGQKFPGYGMMVMDYAHSYGSFYRIQFQ